MCGVQHQILAQESDSDSKVVMKVENARIWPIQDVSYRIDGSVKGKILAGTPLRILKQKANSFEVSYEGQKVTIDSSVCLINLPDVMQKEMEYDIKNSYSSIYKVNKDDIPEVTGEVLYPYAKLSNREYLVPLLYPVAQKLYEAENDAIKEGYTIKIYDAYRPYEVTKYIYQKMNDFLEKNPEYKQYINATVNGVTYAQNFFLAKSVSNHNYGVAVDMTMVVLATGREIDVQSDMHELSVASVLSLNTKDATFMQNFMVEHGFKGLVSEWWHFEIRSCRGKYAAFQVKDIEEW